MLRWRFGPSFLNSLGIRMLLNATKRKPKDWAKVQAELEQLKKAAPPVVRPAADGPVQPGLSSE